MPLLHVYPNNLLAVAVYAHQSNSHPLREWQYTHLDTDLGNIPNSSHAQGSWDDALR